MSLNVVTISPKTGQPPAGLVVALHGWGSNAQDLASLTPFLNLPSFQFMVPDAPFRHPHVSGGWMWYDLHAGYAGLGESRQLLREWLQSLEGLTGVPRSRTILLGFSQGAAMTLDLGLHLPLAGLVALSGYLHPVNQPPVQLPPPVLIVHGCQDQVVPLRSAQAARDQLTRLGVALQYHELAMGHEIKPEVLALIRSFIATVLESKPSDQVR